MPHLVLQLSGAPDPSLAREAAQAIQALTHDVLGKAHAVMATTVHFVPAELWLIGGRSLAELGASAYHLDISISDETNTKAEKARFIEQVHAAMARLLPALHETSYIHVIDARATAYGYGGHTQEWRHQQAGV